MPRSDGPLMVAIEGPDGVGKGLMVVHLRSAFNTTFRPQARIFHHNSMPKPFCDDPWRSAVNFAAQRAAATMPRKGEVFIADRWFWSTRVEALTRGVPDATQNAMLALVVAERAEYDGRVARGELRPMRTILLDAPTKVLEARTTQRDGKVHPNLAAIRSEYLSLAKNLGWPVVSTDCPIEEAAAKATKIIDEWVSEESDS